MKCFGPKKWCKFLTERLADAKDQDVVIISLNPTRELKAHIRQLAIEVDKGSRIVTYSLTSRSDLDRDPQLARLLAKTDFIQGPDGSIVEFFKATPRR
jgi:hypothetical protein